MIAIIGIAFFCLMETACEQPTTNEVIDQSTNGRTNLDAIITELPDAPGAEVFKRNCMSCHSAKYVEMQPDLSRKTWETVVNKMVHTFHAPVTDSSAKIIIDYLVAIKGSK